jgi:hypothetical protein
MAPALMQPAGSAANLPVLAGAATGVFWGTLAPNKLIAGRQHAYDGLAAGGGTAMHDVIPLSVMSTRTTPHDRPSFPFASRIFEVLQKASKKYASELQSVVLAINSSNLKISS